MTERIGTTSCYRYLRKTELSSAHQQVEEIFNPSFLPVLLVQRVLARIINIVFIV